MWVYLLIFGIATICAVLLLWYFDPLKEGFQNQSFKRSYTTMPNTDYARMGDISSFIGTVAQAQAVCDVTPGCTGFTYNGTTAFLKNVLSSFIPTISALTYYVADVGARSYIPLTNTDYPGQGDLFSVQGSFTQAQQACDTTPNCNGFSYNGTTAYLKEIKPSYTSASSATTLYIVMDPSTTAFWDLVDLANKQDPATISALSKVSGPDPNDPNDLMPLTFSKYISLYAMAKFNNDLSGARMALFSNYNTLQNDLSTKVYTRTNWSDPKAQSCANLETARANYIIQYRQLVAGIQDLSGSAIRAGLMRDQNLAYQMTNQASCQNSLSPACINLASQEGPIFSLLAKYDTVNNKLLSDGVIDISNNINTINNAYTLLGCGPYPNLFFKNPTTKTVYYVINGNAYLVKSCTGLCNDTTIAAMCANPTEAPQPFFDSLIFPRLSISNNICPMIQSSQAPAFSLNDTGMVDTVTLTTKLNQMSPYYLSPVTLQYITSSIISGSDISSILATDSDNLSNISNVISNLKAITGTS